MSQRAPELPTTSQLHLAYAIDDATRYSVQQARADYSEVFNNPETGLVSIDGGCGITIEESDIILAEAPEVMASQKAATGYYKGYRVNPYKPRTKAEDWHGAETTHPEESFELITTLARIGVRNAMEIAYPYHVRRYGARLAFAWTGGRNAENTELIDELAMLDISLPLGIKNGLDGEPNLAINHVERVNHMRQDLAYKLGVVAAPAILIYRGGKNAQTPDEWENVYLDAYDATNGKVMVCTGHGTEMAHHEKGWFEKSVKGQIIAQEHLVELAERGYAPAGIMAEASNCKGKTDPNMPLDISLANGKALYEAKMNVGALQAA